MNSENEKETEVRLSRTRKVRDFFAESGDTILFHNPDTEDDGAPVDDILYVLSKRDYEDMGRPAQITVTIEPGDRLNEESKQ